MTLTVKLLTPHREGCSEIGWTNPHGIEPIVMKCEDCGVEIQINAISLDRAIAEALEKQP